MPTESEVATPFVDRRRFITFEELYGVIESLGYHK